MQCGLSASCPRSASEGMTNSGNLIANTEELSTKHIGPLYVALLIIASLIYLGCVVSPPFLMDDTDAAVAQISRNMVTSGDWVTPRLNGILFFEKPPLYFW